MGMRHSKHPNHGGTLCGSGGYDLCGVSGPPTCKRCLAALAKRDRAFRNTARKGFIRTRLDAPACTARYWPTIARENASRAIAAEEGRL